MKFSLNKTEFVKGLDVVSKGISTHATEPVLSGVYIEAADDLVIFRSSTGILSIQYEVSALVEEAGKCVIPGKTLISMIKSYPDCSIQAYTQDNKLVLECGSARPFLNSIDAELFPAFPHAEINSEVKLPFKDFSKLVKRVSKIVSKEEDRPILTGIQVAVKNNTLVLFSTDSYRIACTSMTLEGNTGDFEAVIPGAFLLDIVSLPLDDEFIKISLSENQIVIECNNTIFINRKIEGAFPPCDKLEPKTYAMQLEISTSKFKEAIKRNAIITANDGSVIVKGDPDGGLVELESLTQEIGKFDEKIECSGNGQAKQIAFRCSYLLDILNSVPTNTFFFEVDEVCKSGVVRSTSAEENFWFLLTPVRI